MIVVVIFTAEDFRTDTVSGVRSDFASRLFPRKDQTPVYKQPSKSYISVISNFSLLGNSDTKVRKNANLVAKQYSRESDQARARELMMII